MGDNFNFDFNSEATLDQIESVIDAGIASSPIWAQGEGMLGSNLYYNTPVERDELIDAIANSQNPVRALAYVQGFLKFPKDATYSHSVGSKKFAVASSHIRLIDSFKVGGVEIDQRSYAPMYTTIPSPIDYIVSLAELSSTTAFFSRNNSLNKFDKPTSYFIIAANQYLAEFIQGAYVQGWQEQAGTNSYKLPKIVLPSASVGLNDALDVYNLQAAIEAAEVADMELGYWQLLQLVIQPKSQESGNLIERLDEYVQKQIN